MPDALKLPGMGRAVIPLMRAGYTVVDELVAHGLPRFSSVVRALHHLTEPAARLRSVQPIRIRRRSLHVVNFPAGKVRAADVPICALAIRRQHKCPFSRAHQYSYLAHSLTPF